MINLPDASVQSPALPPCNILTTEDASLQIFQINDQAAAVTWALIRAIQSDPELLAKANSRLEELEGQTPDELIEMVPLARRLLASSNVEIERLWFDWVVIENVPAGTPYWKTFGSYTAQSLLLTARVIWVSARCLLTVCRLIPRPTFLLLRLLLYLMA